MAPKTAPIGSVAWISAEKENVRQLLQEEKEELVFPAQHEIEWLNEHLEEIFSKRQLNMTNVFKTPGKMKGKTPRTNRKRLVGETRMPLTDVFTSQSAKKHTQPIVRPMGQRPPPPKFEIAQDASAEPARRQEASQPDSGYQGSIESPIRADEPPVVPQRSPLRNVPTPQSVARPRQERERTTDGSFHSAKEDQTAKVGLKARDKAETRQQEEKKQIEEAAAAAAAPTPKEQAQQAQPNPKDNEIDMIDLDVEDIGSPSDESTPDRPLVRKGSLTFASLPAREPLKTSIGARVSRTSHSIHQNIQPRPESFSMHEHEHEQEQGHHNEEDGSGDHGHDSNHEHEHERMMDEDEDEDEDVVMEDSHIEILGRDESEDESQPIRMPNKTAAQRLHDKLEQLGKAPRTSKSIPSLMAASKSTAAPPVLHRTSGPNDADDEDDWIKPLASPGKHEAKTPGGYDDDLTEDEFDVRAPELIAYEARLKTPLPSPSPRPALGHIKSHSTVTLASPSKAAMAPASPGAKSISVSNPGPQPSTTPQDSPRRYLDLSASKQKLHSIMKTAKSLFTHSAGVSAAAKQEVLSPCAAVKAVAKEMPGMFPQSNPALDKPLPPLAPHEGRVMRSSTEREREDKRREKETRAMQKMNEDLERVRQKEAQKAAHQKAAAAAASPQKQAEPAARVVTTAAAAAKARPAPVAIKVGMQRMPASSSSIANSKQETLPAEPRRPRLTKKASITSISSQSTNNLKTSVHAPVGKPRALLAAERKKLQDEQEAARKLEQKREMERRRQAQQEEARKQQEEKRAEEERRERERVAAEHAKRQAQQQAIEKKRQEAARKAEQQRLERERAAAAAAVGPSSSTTSTAGESGRPASRPGNQQHPAGRSLINHPLPTNPAKPPKRPMEEDNGRLQAAKYGGASQQQDAKRRKSEEDEQSGHRPTMSGAPIRQSNLGKKPNQQQQQQQQQQQHQQHQQHQPTQASHSQLGQFPQPPSRAQPPQMSQFAHQKIPFAAESSAAYPPPQIKTPAAAAAAAAAPPPPSSIRQIRTIQAVKSSPQFPNGESIQLPDIPTDSEDEDSDDEANAFAIPDWATPGHLREQLLRQEGIDGDAIFGPIAPLKMEEIFAKGSKERLKRLRDRTSSANWTMSGDGLTLEEVRADREKRERIRLGGGWQYGLN